MELLTPRLRLRELELDDAPACNAYERLPEVVRYQSHGVRTLEESRDYIARVRAESAKEPRQLFDLALTLLPSTGSGQAQGALIGRVGLAVRSAEERTGELWYVLHPEHQGKGYVTEAMRALVGLGFGQLGLHRLTVDVDPRNQASAQVAVRLGMRQEAHFVENYWCKGEWTDSLIFGLLEREWRNI